MEKQGIYCNQDKTTYTFKNIKTGEIFKGKRTEFRDYTNGKNSTIERLINGKTKKYKNSWVLI